MFLMKVAPEFELKNISNDLKWQKARIFCYECDFCAKCLDSPNRENLKQLEECYNRFFHSCVHSINKGNINLFNRSFFHQK